MEDPLDLICRIPAQSIDLDPLHNPLITYTSLKEDNSIFRPSSLHSTNKENKYLTISFTDFREEIKAFPDGRKNAVLFYPYEKINRCGFINRGALKLANLDYHFHLTGLFSFERPQSIDFFPACDIAGGPGGFSEYILYRYPMGTVFGITFREAIDWNLNLKRNERFFPFYGSDLRGDLTKCYKEYRDEAVSRQLTKYPLVVSDGGSDKAENLFVLFLIEAYLGVCLSGKGGKFVLKLYDTLDENTAQLIYYLTKHFDTVSLFKPIMSRPYNREVYVIACGRNDRFDDIEMIIDQLIIDRTIQIRLYENIPSSFYEWLTQNNNLRFSQIEKFNRLNLELNRNEKMSVDEYKVDLHKFIAYMKMNGEKY